jgi:YihY family inner membrane protein
MNKLQKSLRSLDRFQQKHHISAFTVAVIKKYNDDSAGRQAALLTYYSFLSVFPLLLILTTVVDSLISGNEHIRSVIIKGITNYFPLLGNQLSTHVHRLHSNGLPLILGLLLVLYGTRGVANAFSRGVQDIWGIPKNHRDAFPKTLYKSMLLVIFGGAGLILASVIASLASSAGRGLDFRILSIAANFIMLFWLFRLLLDLSLPAHVPLKETRIGAAAAAIGLIIVQMLGGYILAHELKHLSALYSYFAVTLSILFWIYLQAQVLYYAIEIALVSSRKRWPVHLTEYPT